MPFTLAHPAAVLPLRRYCPRFLSFPALIVGSLSPDLGYVFGKLKVDEFSHRLIGSIGFCLPAGAIMLVLFYGVLLPAVERLPSRYRQMVPPMSLKPLGAPTVVLLSLLVGAWTHLMWDSFTHKNGWFVQHLPLLQTPLVVVAGHSVRVFHLLWYGSSFAGIILLFLSYDAWQQTLEGRTLPKASINWRSAVLLAVLVLPIELVHHLVHGALGLGLVGVLTLALLIGIVLRIAPAKAPLTQEARFQMVSKPAQLGATKQPEGLCGRSNS